MDPIMKLLEEDEDEMVHSGAAVEAFTAALNRDIEGDTSTSHSANALMPQGSNQMSDLYSQWQSSNQDGNGNNQSQTDVMNLDQQANHSAELDLKPYGPGAESKQQEAGATHAPSELLLQPKTQDSDHDRKEEQNPIKFSQSSGMQNLDKVRNHNQIQDSGALQQSNRESQLSNMQNQSASASAPEQANRTKQIPFGSLLPIILPELDKDRAMQLQTLYTKLRKNEIPKDGFVRLMRSIVGDQMLKVAVVKMQSKMARESHQGPNQLQLQSQNSMQPQQLRPPVISANDPYQFAQLHQRGQEPHGMQVNQMPTRPAMTAQGLAKQQQQNLHFPHTSYPVYGSGNFHPYAATAVNASSGMVKTQPVQGQIPQGFGSTTAGGATQALGVGASNFERQHTFNDSKRVPSGSISHMPNNSTGWQASSAEEQKYGASSLMSYVKQEPVDPTNEQQSRPPVISAHGTAAFGQQFDQGNTTPGVLKDEVLERHPSRPAFTPTTAAPQNSMPSPMAGPTSTDFQAGPQIPSASSAVIPPSNTKSAPKKSFAGQKKPLDPVGSSPPLPSKKQKVSGAFSDQSIEQLNDVTAVSGVNLREEEEQLFSGPKDDTRASEASRRVVQEEEDKLLLQKLPLQKKLAEIMTRCGLKNLGNDVERCLSLCVEERLRGLLSSMIRISRQRVDFEKSRHRTVVTSDVRQQILAINRKAREEWDKEQAEADKLRRLGEPDNDMGLDGDKDKDENRVKSLKVNKEEDDKMRATAANVAARAAVGGDDMLSKWQLMAEQARQKREGGADAGTSPHPGKEPNRKNSSTSRNQGAGKKDSSVSAASGGASRRGGRNQSTRPQLEAAQNITVKDVIAVLEREPQTTKSTVLYRLYEITKADASSEQGPG